MGLKKLILSVLLTIAVSSTLIIVIPYIPPSIELTPFDIKNPRKVQGWFATNFILDEAELYFEQKNAGFESLAMRDDGVIFTGDQLGNILKIADKQVAKNITSLKFPCDSNPFAAEKDKVTCGWPLGMRFDKNGFLYVMDYFGGLTKIDVAAATYENIIPKSRPIGDKFSYVPEDLDISGDGTIYWTDGSTIGDFFVEMIGEPSGRLIRYDSKTRKNEILLDNLYFSNGVCLSDDETFVLVSETGHARILRYYLHGKLKGSSDIFVDGLPGYPDNIRGNGRGGFFVALAAPWNDEYSMRVHLLAPRPTLRKLILRSRHLLLNLIGYVKQLLPGNIYLDIIEKYVAQNEPILRLNTMPKTATVVELSGSGSIIGILNGKSGKVSGLSQITVGKNFAFLVSPFESKIWRIKLDVLRRMH